MAIGDWLGSLFGGTPTYTPQPGGTDTPPGTLAGLLDPRGIREQAFYSGLGALSQGLLAAGMRRPAASPSPLPQALGAFQPAYQGALQSGYQSAAAEQQLRQQQEDEQRLEAYRRANPAFANLPRAALVAHMSRQPPTGFEPDPTAPGRLRPIQGGPADTAYARALADAQRDPNLVVTEGGAIVERATGRIVMSRPPAPTYHTHPVTGEVTEIQRPAIGGTIGQPGGQPQPAPAPGGTAPSTQPPQPGQSQAAPSSAPLGLRHNNPLNLGGEDAIRRNQWTYATPEEGAAAAVRQITLNASRNPNGTLTPLQLAQGWATTATPAAQQSYAREIALVTNTPIDQPLNLRDPAVMARIVTRMAQVEQGALPGGYSDAIARGVQQGFQPGPIRPGSQRMYAGAGGTGPRAQPQIAPAAVPPPTAAPPQAAAPPVAGPPGTQSRVVVPGRTPDPLEVGGAGWQASLFNTYTRLERKRVTEGLTTEEAWLHQRVQQQLEAVVRRPDGSEVIPPRSLPLPDRAAPAAPALPAAGAPVPAPAAPPAPAAAPPATSAPPPPADGRPPSQVARPGEPPIPDGMFRRRGASGGFTDIPLQQQPATAVTHLTENAAAMTGIDRALGELARRESSVGAVPGAIAAITGDRILQRTDPEGTRLRAMIAEISSTRIHSLTGASQTISEVGRLRPFIPDISDNHETIRTKLAGLREALADMTGGLYEAYGPSADYRSLPHVERVIRPPEPTPGSFRQTPYLMNGTLDETAESGVRPGQVYQLNLQDGTQVFGRWVVRPPTGGMERRAGFEPVIWRNGRWVARPEGQ